MMVEFEKLKAYLREREVEYELGKDEAPFAVLWLTGSVDPASLRNLAEQLRTWMRRNPGTKRILGLERLLGGKCPKVSALLLMIPFSPAKPESCVEKVAFVVMNSGANIEGDEASLCDPVEGSGFARVVSWEQYSYMNR